MRVLLIGYLFGRGGIQSHTHWLATGLLARGHDVLVVTPEPIRGGSRDLPVECGYETLVYRNSSLRLRLSALLKISSLREFDVSVVSGTGLLAMAGILFNRRIKAKIFFEVMSGDRNTGVDPRWLVRGGFDAIVGQAPSVEKRFCEQFGWRGLSTAIPALPDPLEQFGAINIPDFTYSDGLSAAYFGRLTPHKGVRYLIENWDHFRQNLRSLDVYGTGEQEPELHELVAQRNLTDVVRLHGQYPSGKEYVRLLQSHHLLLLPTVGKEGAPLVLLEAMACGIPFVANGVGGIPNYANEDCEITGGHINEFPFAVTKQCVKMKSAQFDSRRLQRLYSQKFSFKSLTDQWQDFLLNVVDRRRAG